MLTLIAILSFATVALLTVGLAMKGEREIVRQRVESLRLMLDQDIESVVPELATPFRDRILRPFLIGLAGFFTKQMPSSALVTISVKLEQAGNPWRLKALEFVGLKALSIAVFTAAGITFALLVDTIPLYKILCVVIGAMVGLTLPDSLLAQAIRERQRLVRKALPDCLDLLVVCTEAGLGFDGAIAKVVERMRGPLSDELKKVLEDMSVGRTRVESLRAMAGRLGMSEFTAFVAAIQQADALGVSIGQVLRVQAESQRSNRNIRARESAAKLPVKLLFPLVFFIFPSIFIVVLSPGAVQIWRALADVGK